MSAPTGNKFARGGARKGAGRPRSELRELAGLHREEALNRLVFWMKGDNAKASVAACMAILDRSDGKPVQQVESSSFSEIIEMMRAKYA